MKIVLFANTDWYLFNFRVSLAVALRDAGYEVLLVSPSGDYGRFFSDLGLRWVAAPLNRRSLNPFTELRFLFWFWRLLRVERPSLVHGFTVKCAIYGSIAARLSGVGLRVSSVAGMGYVFTNHGALAKALRWPVSFLLRATLAGRGGLLILQNPDDVQLFLKARLVGPGHIRLIRGSGVDCSRFGFPAPQMQRPKRVLLAARLLWDKGLADFVDAIRILQKQERTLQFLLAGAPDPGNPAAVAEDTVKAWVEEGLLNWLGHVDDMPALLSRVDIVVLPSYREGLPRGLIEAAASSLPIVTTDVPGCREVVTDGVDGLLVPVRDPVALAAAIARLDDDQPLAARLGEAARAKALEQFDERIVIHKTIAVYRELLDRHCAA